MNLLQDIQNYFRGTESKINRIDTINSLLKEISLKRDILVSNYNAIAKGGFEDDMGFDIFDFQKSLGEMRRKEKSLQRELGVLNSDKDVVGILSGLKEKEAKNIVKSLYKEGKITLEDYNKTPLSVKTEKGQVKYADVVVVTEENEILLLMRSMFDSSNPGAWVIPGGHVDEGETDEQAAKRELLEESGISVDNLAEDISKRTRFYQLGSFEDDKVHISYYCLIIPKKEDVELLLQAEETRDYLWVPNTDLINYEMVFNMRDNILKMMDWELTPQQTIIRKAFEQGVIDEEVFNKAMGHKYIRKEPDGKGGWNYIYIKNVDQNKQIDLFEKRCKERDLPNVSEFAAKILPSKYLKQYKGLYELASSVGVEVNVERGVLPPGLAASWHMGQINVDSRTIKSELGDIKEVVETLNHEIIHGILSRGISYNNFELHTDLKPIWEKVQSKFDTANDEVKGIISYIADTSKEFKVRDPESDGKKTTGDLEEMITYAFTNKAFAEFLQTIPSENKAGGNRSIFSDLMDIIKSFLSKSMGKTALDDIKDTVEKYFNIDWNVKQFGERNTQYEWGKKFKVEEHIDTIEKSVTHKYIRKEPDGKGGWNYVYKEDADKGVANNEIKNPILKKGEEVKDILEKLGVNFENLTTSFSHTDFGNSYYLTYWDQKNQPVKFRISDHDVENFKRATEESHFRVNDSSLRIAKQIEILTNPERYDKVVSSVKYYTKEEAPNPPTDPYGKYFRKRYVYPNQVVDGEVKRIIESEQQDNYKFNFGEDVRHEVLEKEFSRISKKSKNPLYKYKIATYEKVVEEPTYSYIRKEPIDYPDEELIQKAINLGLLSDDDIEKSWKKHPVGTVVTRKDGRKYRKISETNNSKQDWVEVKDGKSPKTEDLKKDKQGKQDIGDSAKEASEVALQNAIKRSPDEEIRRAAHEELKRREKEERNEDDEDEIQISPQEKFANEMGKNYVEESIKKLPKIYADKYDLKSGELKNILLDKLKPTQEGEDRINDSSKNTADTMRQFLSGQIDINDVRSDDFYPILVDSKTMEILDGNHRYSAYEMLGLKSVNVVMLQQKEKDDDEDKAKGSKKIDESENKYVEKFRTLSDEQVKFYLDAPYPEVKEAAKFIADERRLSVVSKEDYIKQFEDYGKAGEELLNAVSDFDKNFNKKKYDSLISKEEQNEYINNIQKERGRLESLGYSAEHEKTKMILKYIELGKGQYDQIYNNSDYEYAINYYKLDGFYDIRKFLSGSVDFKDKGEIMKKQVEILSDFISKNKIDKDIVLNRMVSDSRSNPFFLKLEEGDIYEDKSFSSSSMVILPQFGDFRIKILAKKGSNVSNIQNNNELEYLIDKGSKFRVIEKHKNGMGITVELL